MKELKQSFVDEMNVIEHSMRDKLESSPLINYYRSLPYNLAPTALYTSDDLFDVYDPEDESSFDRCLDTLTYHHVLRTGKVTASPFELTARVLHDMCIGMQIEKFLGEYDQRQVVGIMGGHSVLRNSASYRKAVEVSKYLTELGCLMISGGGPGAMEATHLGAWMAGRSEEDVNSALEMLAVAPSFQDKDWFSTAFRVKEKFPLKTKYRSLAIPTWFYGHEPPTIFATHIAKMFKNSTREDDLLTDAYGGLIFFEGSAGTVQEIFEEAVQDHYLTLGYASPMVFVGRKYWVEDVPVVPFIEHMLNNGRYKNLIVHLVDTTDEIMKVIQNFREESINR